MFVEHLEDHQSLDQDAFEHVVGMGGLGVTDTGPVEADDVNKLRQSDDIDEFVFDEVEKDLSDAQDEFVDRGGDLTVEFLPVGAVGHGVLQ